MNKYELTAWLCLAGGMLVWILILVIERNSPISFLLPVFGLIGTVSAAADRRIWLAIANALMMISPLAVLFINELVRV
ncbi:hypothetical protein KP77_12640 [Jeotgalibacillus alimentarius]|uniref:Uncharacterized protein n=1 Tax=Jeotgalibacillus alimentarius TaxID=135826 RepID=A0A0C2VS49_9BACL|nr:hypothetical protein [Jeotgalibacillus alimentarius]KIL51752.1 hypothetical protein KP77_12640 [Jeotgalibacillus alimentarius]